MKKIQRITKQTKFGENINIGKSEYFKIMLFYFLPLKLWFRLWNVRKGYQNSEMIYKYSTDNLYWYFIEVKK